jgi:succinate dehydrogenase / fumarate reductase cytochrome b subunit
MGTNHTVGFFEGLKYRGGGPMIAWMLHRITGVGILVFVSLHVVASFFMQQTGSEIATSMNIVYESWIFQIMMAFFVIFHALNGLRVAIQDLWPQSQMYQREALWLEWLVIAPVFGLTAVFLIQRGLAG